MHANSLCRVKRIYYPIVKLANLEDVSRSMSHVEDKYKSSSTIAIYLHILKTFLNYTVYSIEGNGFKMPGTISINDTFQHMPSSVKSLVTSKDCKVGLIYRSQMYLYTDTHEINKRVVSALTTAGLIYRKDIAVNMVEGKNIKQWYIELCIKE